jgi:UrcA family protein
MKPIIVRKSALIAMAALATTLTANLASATTIDDGVRQTLVHYSDLDLARTEDARRLYGRILRAASAVCDTFRSPDLQRAQIYRECRDKAVASAVAKLQSPQVTAIASSDNQHQSKR